MWRGWQSLLGRLIFNLCLIPGLVHGAMSWVALPARQREQCRGGGMGAAVVGVWRARGELGLLAPILAPAEPSLESTSPVQQQSVAGVVR